VLIATRGGVKSVRKTIDGEYAVAMGKWHAIPTSDPVAVQVDAHSWNAMAIAMPNPHAVTFVDDLSQAGSLLSAPIVTPSETFPDGVNVEFVVDRARNHVAMRVFERGVGETLSCGTGACAVAVAARRRGDAQGETRWQVDVPGGTLWIEESVDCEITLIGPAEIVAEGTITLLGTHEF
jgi:diaminopimelate epimerase